MSKGRRLRAKRLAETAHAKVIRTYDASVIACCPVDTSTLPKLNGVQPPEPSIEHSITRCGPCGADVWIGPTQAEMAKLGHPVLCYWCLARSGPLGDVHTLDPQADDTLRRRG
jgi:hypothetical protein